MIKSELEVKLLSNKEFSCQIIRGLWVQISAATRKTMQNLLIWF